LTLPRSTARGRSLAFSPDGKLLATLPGQRLKLWDVGSRREVATLPSPEQPTSIAFSPDGKTLATSSVFTNTLTVWDLATKREVPCLKALSGPIRSLAFSPDGKRLATGHESGDLPLKLWDVATKRVVTSLQGHPNGVPSVAFSPDGNTLATGSFDGPVQLWRAVPFAETDAPAGARPREASR
jgi:WD40 repeat protein